MRFFALSICIIFLSQVKPIAQTIRSTQILIEDRENSLIMNRIVFFRNANVSRNFTARRETNNELGIRKQANQSMRASRNALARKRLIRKEKSKIEDESCQKTFNAYVQHDCLAYNSLENPTQSLELHRDELVVLSKQKKHFYKLCIAGESFYIFRKQE